jgi:hypothetical protein
LFVLDGELMIWNGSNRRLESVIVHKTCITSLIFNTDGTRLLSADQVNLRNIFFYIEVYCYNLNLGWSYNHLES